MGFTADMQTRDTLISRVDEQLAHVNERIKSADEQLVRMEAQFSGQERAARHFRPRQSQQRPWLRGILGLLLIACIVAAAFVSQSSYGDSVARWAPRVVSALAVLSEKQMLLMHRNPSSAQLAAAEPPVQIKPSDTTTTAVQVFSNPAKSLETMTRDLADLERKIEMLNAMVTDNANAVEQIQASQMQVVRDIARNAELLKASQEQVAKLVATASQQNVPPRTSPLQQQAPFSARKPVLTPASSHASAPPQAPTQLRREER